MRVFPMFKKTTTWICIAPPTIDNFKWGWDSNPWVPLMLHYLLKPHIHNLPMFSLRSIKPPDSLIELNTYANRSMIFYRNPMLSTSIAMINTKYHTCFRWETRFGYICRKNTLHGTIKSLVHFTVGLILSDILWEITILSSTLPHSLA
jgi:hypothetical protein